MQFMQIMMLNLKKSLPVVGGKACLAHKIFTVAKIFINSAPEPTVNRCLLILDLKPFRL